MRPTNFKFIDDGCQIFNLEPKFLTYILRNLVLNECLRLDHKSIIKYKCQEYRSFYFIHIVDKKHPPPLEPLCVRVWLCSLGTLVHSQGITIMRIRHCVTLQLSVWWREKQSKEPLGDSWYPHTYIVLLKKKPAQHFFELNAAKEQQKRPVSRMSLSSGISSNWKEGKKSQIDIKMLP